MLHEHLRQQTSTFCGLVEDGSQKPIISQILSLFPAVTRKTQLTLRWISFRLLYDVIDSFTIKKIRICLLRIFLKSPKFLKCWQDLSFAELVRISLLCSIYTLSLIFELFFVVCCWFGMSVANYV